MRTALCISGSPRYLDECFSFIKNRILDRHACDVFIHAWNHLAPDGMGKLISLYGPKLHVCEDQKHFTGRGNSRSMWYSVKQCNMLKSTYEKDNNFRYDLVIRCRPDLVMLSPCDFYIEPNSIYFNVEGERANDQFAYGNSDVMNVYSNIFDYATEERINEKYPEDLLMQYLRESGLTIRHSALDFFVAREKGYDRYPHPRARQIMEEARRQ